MHLFRIDALADPQSLARVAGFFAQRSIIPSGMSAVRDHGWMRIEISVPDLGSHQASMIAAKLGEAVAVAAVELEETMELAA